MIITCGNCNTSYELDESIVKATGTQVRCTSCQSIFTAFPPAAPEPPQAAPRSPGGESCASR